MEGLEGLIFVILIFWVLPALLKGKKSGKKQQNAQQSTQATRPAAQRQTPSVQMHRPAPAMNRAPAAANHAHRDFSAPEAPCIVCENTGEDHFQRDKARRLKQLDDWLKIGLIDRDEYRVLKDRYQRGI